MPEAPPPPPAPTVVSITTTFSLAASLAARFGLEHPNDGTNITEEHPDDDPVGASLAAMFDDTNEQVMVVEAPTLTPVAV